MSNQLLTPRDAANLMLKVVRKQIKEMKKDGMTDKQIQDVFNASLGGLAYGPL